MKASEIREGQRLEFKPERREAYGLWERGITVFRVTYKDGYKTPYIWDELGRAFRPVDFA